LKRYRAISLALIAALTLTSAPALAKTPKPTLAQIEAAKKVEAEKKKAADAQAAKLAAANQNLRTLTAKANAATALYVKAQKELAIAEVAARAAAKYAAETATAVEEAHRVIGRLAANAYILGGSMSDIEPLLSANGPQDLMDQLSTLSTLGSKNTIALERFKAAEVIARAAKAAADEAKVAQQKATDKVAAAKKTADDAKAEQAKEVAKLQKVQDKLMKDLLSARKVRTTLEQQRQLALLEEAQANQAGQTPGQAKIWPDIGFKGRSTIRTDEAQRLKAVEFAKKQVLARKPYVWGSEGPNTFDCSGLVYAAYKYAGLGWPNWDRLNSALYTGYTKHVSLNALVRGNGMMWEANSKDKGLLYSSIYSVKGLMPFGGRV
jgi:cell wall-associated NlpC family hydrolase